MVSAKWWTKAKAFISKFWWVFVGISLIVLGYFIGRGNTGSISKWRDVQDKLDNVDKKKEERLEKIEQEKDNKIKEIEEEHSETIQQLDIEQRNRYEELKDDPKRLNRYLNSLLPK